MGSIPRASRIITVPRNAWRYLLVFGVALLVSLFLPLLVSGQGATSISGVVFNDLNGNGVQDPGEPGIAGVAITVDVPPGGTALLPVFTGLDGTYQAVIPPGWAIDGIYTVTETDPAGYVSVTPNVLLVSVQVGSNSTADFADRQASTISGMVFDDLNGNGIPDGGESGLAGIGITANPAAPGGTVLLPIFSDADGFYLFTGVGAGTYVVAAAAIPGQMRTSLAEVSVSLVGGGNASANFGYQPVGTIRGVVFDDANGNGVQDRGEAGIAGVGVAYDGSATTTSGTGSYTFTSVTAGSYIVTSEAPTGTVRTTPAQVPVSLAADGSATANFGFVPEGQVTGQCYQDLDGDGERGPGEPGLACEVTLSSDPVTIFADVDGFFRFPAVEPGRHSLSVTPPSGFAPWSAPKLSVYVGPGGSAHAAPSSQRQGTIGGRVFDDANGDGVKDAGESGLGGVAITLVGGGVTRATATTGAGLYTFQGLAAGLYSVREADPPGYSSTTPNKMVVLLPSEGSSVANFGDQANGTIGGRVFDDRNGDGRKSASEPGIGGVTVDLKTPAGALVATTTTAGNGAYAFGGVGNGNYRVEEQDPAGFVSTTPNAVNIALSAQAPSASVNYGDRLTGSVGGVVFLDRDGDGAQDGAEAGIAGAVVTLTLQSTAVFTQATVGDGSYVFSGVPPGNHTVTEGDPPGFDSTTPNAVAVALTGGAPSASANYGDLPAGTIGGLVYDDLNKDGAQDRGERGVGGATVALRTAAGGVLGTTTTAMGGSYLFEPVAAGNYVVEETNPEGFYSTTPDRRPVSLAADQGAAVNFGDRAGWLQYLPMIFKRHRA